MMRSWSRFCFLVLAISSMPRAKLQTTPAPVLHTDGEGTTPSPGDNTSQPTVASPAPQNHEPVNASYLPTTNVTEGSVGHDPGKSSNTSEGDNGNTTAVAPSASIMPLSTEADTEVGDNKVSTTMASTSTKPVTIVDADSSSWGYVILVFIIVVIIILCVILFFLRRASRTYSFDLHRTEPINQQRNEPIGTFGQVYLDDLAPKDQDTTDDLSPPPVVNGTSLQVEEKVSNGENAPQEQPDANGLEPSPAGNTSPSPGDDAADRTSNPPSSSDLFFDAPGEVPQNENNNNPSICSTDPFVEINLDDPEWCDHLLTSAEASSSVLPFSPFSFSSSSS